jgi:AbrB family looped-hinge helix DNA binding protein
MPSAMVTFNGRITLPFDIRKQLGLKTGDNVDFVEIEKGRFAICPRPATGSGVDEAVPAMAYESAAKETVQ